MNDSSKYISGSFPLIRMRRNRMEKFSRKITKENFLNVENLILPLFVAEEKNENTPIDAMPGVYRHSIISLVKEAIEAYELGIPAIAIFPYIDKRKRDANGTNSLDSDNIVCRSIKAVKESCPNLGVICDVALDPFTDHGQDGIIVNNIVDNDKTIEILCQQAIVQINAGCDIIAPSDMMDGRVRAIRIALDEKGFTNKQIMSYSAKYASSFYGPFRDALNSNLDKDHSGKNTYQINPANIKEALREIKLDIDEGADMVMIKPALPYLDVIREANNLFNIPIIAYQVSGEYSMIKSASINGYINEKNAVLESLISIKRAGASCIFTYFAKDVARELE